jgi:hypothetical protein
LARNPLLNSNVSGDQLFLEEKKVQGQYEHTQTPALSMNSQRRLEVTTPPASTSSYGSSNLSIHQLSPTSAQAALAQIRNIHQKRATHINASDDFRYGLDSAVAQEEFARMNAVQSHRARMRELLGSPEFPEVPQHHPSSMADANGANTLSVPDGQRTVNEIQNLKHLMQTAFPSRHENLTDGNKYNKMTPSPKKM